jgi:hypothetical protein
MLIILIWSLYISIYNMIPHKYKYITIWKVILNATIIAMIVNIVAFYQFTITFRMTL